MSLLTHVLQPPAYGYEANGQLLVPTYRQLFREFFARQNIFNHSQELVGSFWVEQFLSFCHSPYHLLH